MSARRVPEERRCKKHAHDGSDRLTLPFRTADIFWNGQHRGKVIHKWKISAYWHLFRLAIKDRKFVMQIYPCRWTDCVYDGLNGPLHYHVGHLRSKRERKE